MIAVPMSPPSMISPSSMKADGHERHQHVLPLRQQPLVLLAGEQVGAPQDERELAELARLELERAAQIDPVLVAVDRVPYPGHLDQAHQEDRARPAADRPAPGAASSASARRRAAGRRRGRRRGAACGRSTWTGSARLERLDLRGREDHHQTEHGEQQAAAEDEVVRGQRPVPGAPRLREQRRGTAALRLRGHTRGASADAPGRGAEREVPLPGRDFAASARRVRAQCQRTPRARPPRWRRAGTQRP